jgi:hypothetical protein
VAGVIILSILAEEKKLKATIKWRERPF